MEEGNVYPGKTAITSISPKQYFFPILCIIRKKMIKYN